jgi:hypothetical protein
MSERGMTLAVRLFGSQNGEVAGRVEITFRAEVFRVRVHMRITCSSSERVINSDAASLLVERPGEKRQDTSS